MITWPLTFRAARPIIWISERLGAQEALLVGVEDRDQRHLGEVEALPQQVDADQHVELAEAQVADQLDALHRVDLGVQVPHPDAHLEQVVGQVLGHLLGERGDQHPVAAFGPLVDLRQQVVDLALGRLDDDLGVDQAGRAHDLLDDLASSARSPSRRAWPTGRWSGRRVRTHSSKRSGRLSAAEGSRNPCSIRVSLRERSPSYWPCSCGIGDVRLVDDRQVVVGEEVEQRVRRLARCAAVERRRVVLDAVAEAHLLHHLEVVLGAHAQPLRLEQLALVSRTAPAAPAAPSRSARWPRRGARRRWRSACSGRSTTSSSERNFSPVSGSTCRDRLDLVAEQLDADRRLLVRGVHLDDVAADPELAAHQVHVVALVLQIDQAAQQRPLVDRLADPSGEEP